MSAAPAAARKEWARLYRLMMYPEKGWLITFSNSERWLCDAYTLLRVTGSAALHSDDEELPDGRYHLYAGQAPKSDEKKGLVAPEAEKLWKGIESAASPRWLPVFPTLWTVAESGAKAMLVYALDDDGKRWPCYVNEEVWTAYFDAYDRNKDEYRRVLWEKDPRKPKRPFRISLLTPYQSPVDGEEIEIDEVLAYVAPAKMPEGAEGERAAQYLVKEAKLCTSQPEVTLCASPISKTTTGFTWLLRWETGLYTCSQRRQWLTKNGVLLKFRYHYRSGTTCCHTA